MPDIFDQLSQTQAAPKPSGDIFDRLTPTQAAATSQGDIFDHVAPSSRGGSRRPNSTGTPASSAANPFPNPVQVAIPTGDGNAAIGGPQFMTPQERQDLAQRRAALSNPNAVRMGAYTPTAMDRLKAIFGAGPLSNSARTYNNPAKTTGLDTPLLNFGAAFTPSEEAAHPIASGIADVAGGLTTSKNVAIMAGTGAMGKALSAVDALTGTQAAPAISRLVAAGFTAQNIPGIVQSARAFRQSYDAGDRAGMEHALTMGGLSTALAALGGVYAARGESAPRRGATIGEILASKGQQPPTVADVPAEMGGATPESLPVAEQQATASKIASVSPQLFIEKVSRGPINSRLVEEYRTKFEAGEPVEPLSISYDENGNVTDADGRHRALAAMQAGIERVPVRMNWPKPESTAAPESLPDMLNRLLDTATDAGNKARRADISDAAREGWEFKANSNLQKAQALVDKRGGNDELSQHLASQAEIAQDQAAAIRKMVADEPRNAAVQASVRDELARIEEAGERKIPLDLSTPEYEEDLQRMRAVSHIHYRNILHEIAGDQFKSVSEPVIQQGQEAQVAQAISERNRLAQRLRDLHDRLVAKAKTPKGASSALSTALRSTNLKDEVYELQKVIRFAEGRKEYAGQGEPVVDERGVVTAPMPGKYPAMTLKAASRIFGVKRLNRIPPAEEFLAEATRLEAKAKALRSLSERAAVAAPTSSPVVPPREYVSHAEERSLADKLSMSLDDVLSKTAESGVTPEMMVKGNAIMDASLQRTLAKFDVAKDADADSAEMQAAMKALAQHKVVADQVRGKLFGEAGRTLEAVKITPLQKTVNDIADSLNQMKPAAKLEAVRRFAQIPKDNPGALARFAAEVKPSSTRSKLYEAWINALLTGGAIIKKGVGDTMMTLAPIYKAIGGDFRGAKWTSIGMAAGRADAIDAMASTFQNEVSAAHGEFDSPTIAIKGRTGQVVRLPMRSLAALTDFYHAIHYSGSIAEQSAKIAHGEGLRGQEFLDRVSELRANPSRDMRDVATEYAKRHTFQSDEGYTVAISKHLQKLPLVGKVAFPFAKTPANIAVEAARFSPFGVPVELVRHLFFGKELNAENIGKSMIGTAALAWGIGKAKQGLITGSGSQYTPEQRKALEAQGWQPYSVKIGNHYVSIKYWEPVAPLLMAAGDMGAEMSRTGTLADTRQALAAWRATLDFAETLPFLYSITNVAHAMQSPSAAGKVAGSFAGSIIPTGVADIARATDRTVRAPQNAVQEIESRIPGLSRNVPALTSPTGQSIQRPTSAVGGFNPFPVSHYTPNQATQEIQRVISTTRKTPSPTAQSDRQSVRAAVQADVQRRMNDGSWQQLSDAQRKRVLDSLTRRYGKQLRTRR